jgi:23S rRNA (cytosine1962-C5)-methyltransferase
MSAFANRLQKNARHWQKWARRRGLEAFRIYDLDLPEYPFAIDWYLGRVHVMEYPRRSARRDGSAETSRAEVIAAIEQTLQVPAEKIFTKTHEQKAWGRAQYEKLAADQTTFVVQENGLKFEVNLSDYLDTGLFLDHRDTRARVRGEAKGKRVLNLFAYTGSFSVYAAAGEAKQTTTVDLSNTYCDWAERNLRLNGFAPGSRHEVIRADVTAWLERADGQWDLAVVDPPSFSSSKKMDRTWDVQRDHRWLIQTVGERLAPGGTLYFSTNFLGFELDPALEPEEELTPRSIPEDFRRPVHRCFRFVA